MTTPVQRLHSIWDSPVSKLAFVSLLSQLIMGASLPFVARLYGAYSVGVFASILTLSQFAAILSTGRIEQILPRLVLSSRWIVTLLVSLTAICMSVPLGWCIGLYDESGTVALSAIFLVSSISLYGVANMVLLAKKDFVRVGRLRLTNAFVTVFLQFFLATIDPSPQSLISAYGIGSLVASVHACGAVFALWRSADNLRMGRVFREERLGLFALSVGGSALLTSATLGLPIVGLDRIYGAEVAASYFLARRLLSVPSQIVGATLNEVSYAVLARSGVKTVDSHVRRWLKRLVPGAGAVVAFGVVAAWPIQYLLGSEYRDMALVVIFMSVAGAGQLVASSMSNVLLVLHKEHVRFTVNLLRFLMVVLCLLVLYVGAYEYLTAVLLLSVVTFVGFAILLFATLMSLARAMNEKDPLVS